MYAIPLLIVDAFGRPVFHQGSLLHLPPELSRSTRLDWEVANTSPGWRKNDIGFWSFAALSDAGALHIALGQLPDGEKPQRKIADYSPRYSKKQIEEYVRGLIEQAESYRDHAENDLNLLVHDLRKLSATIYFQALEAQSFIPKKQVGELRLSQTQARRLGQRIKSIIASQTMLKMRTDYLDFEGDPEMVGDEEEIPVYRRVDKVVQCFSPLARMEKIVIEKRGSSYGTVKGPSAFEIIPYVLIDNAIKYSPKNENILVRFRDIEDTVIFSVESLGPEINESEKLNIFSKGYRGSSALQSNIGGTGLGLFLANKLVQHFSGEIHVTSMARDDGLALNAFAVRIPRYGEMQRPIRQ
ncbi:MAG: HAMP domain-containing histidine kinase [Hyphomonadaceae bacterium]|nr:HAMP domain-containing histidine kinase [Hyphomonadaceae bacterium]